MKAKLLNPEIVVGKYPRVTGLSYDLEKLFVIYDPDLPGKTIEITFDNPRGFRCLDEGDFFNLWDDPFLVENWLFEVISDGWIDHEDKRGGFQSKFAGYREFFVCGSDDCISVISNSPPKCILRTAEGLSKDIASSQNEN